MVDPEQVVLKDETLHLVAMNYLYTIRNTSMNYPKEFIQIGQSPGVVQFPGPIDSESQIKDSENRITIIIKELKFWKFCY